jgi:diketogulonate reductase-like aldo/keto reductase
MLVLACALPSARGWGGLDKAPTDLGRLRFGRLAREFPATPEGLIAKAGMVVFAGNQTDDEGMCKQADGGSIGLRMSAGNRLYSFVSEQVVCATPGLIVSSVLCALRSAWVAVSTSDSAITQKVAAAHEEVLLAAMRSRATDCPYWDDWFVANFESRDHPRIAVWCSAEDYHGRDGADAANAAIGANGVPTEDTKEKLRHVLRSIDRAMAAAVDLLSSPLLQTALAGLQPGGNIPMHPPKWMVDTAAQPLSQTVTLRGGLEVQRMIYGTGSTGLSEARFEDCENDGVDDIEACEKKADLDAQHIFELAIDNGCRFFDTAQLYSNFEPLGRAIAAATKRDVIANSSAIVISSKLGGQDAMPDWGAYQGLSAGAGLGGLAAAELHRQLRLLGGPQIQILQLHHPEMYTPALNEETRREMLPLQRSGKVLLLGEPLAQLNDPALLQKQMPDGFDPVISQQEVHMVMPGFGSAQRPRPPRNPPGVTVFGYDMLRDWGLMLVGELISSISEMAGMGHPSSMVFALALRKQFIVMFSSRSAEHIQANLREPFLPVEPSLLAVADSLAWLVSWCPPCIENHDGFGIFDGLYRGAVWGNISSLCRELDGCLCANEE